MHRCTDGRDISEILLKTVLNTTQSTNQLNWDQSKMLFGKE